MCKLLIGVNSMPNNEDFEKYIEGQEDELRDQKDGIGALVITFDGEVKIFRNYDNYDEVFRNVYENIANAKLISIHTRTGTSGTKDIRNCHFFESDNYAFAHNGFVLKYHNRWSTFYDSKTRRLWDRVGDDGPLYCSGCESSKKGICKTHDKGSETTDVKGNKSDMCDSYQFIQNIKKPLTIEILKKEIDEKDFNGFGVVIDTKTKKVFLLIKKDVKLQVNDSSCVFGIFYSYMPEKKYESVTFEPIYGIPVVKTKIVDLGLPIKTVANGVFELNY